MDSALFGVMLEYINFVFFMFTMMLYVMFSAMAYFSTRNSIHYKNKNSFVDVSKIMASPLAPSITIIAPSYNEGSPL